MMNETIIFLVYYYDYEDRKNRFLKHFYGTQPFMPFDVYFCEPLQKIFSKVIVYDYAKRMTEVGAKGVNREIIELVRKEHPKYVLWTSWLYDIQESTLETIRKEGSIVGGLFFDDEWRFDDYSKFWIPYLDYCITWALEAVPKYRELSARVIHTTINGGIAIDRDWSNIEEKYDVSFVGSRNYADREQWINEFKNRNIPIHLFGEGWGGYIPFEEMIDIFRTSKINLNFSKSWADLSKPQVKGRIFQVCLAGGFLLTEYAPGIENYFEIDKEFVCFRDTEEMIDKINYYLGHEVERRAIAQAGWKRATSEYTSFHMVSKVFGEIEKDLEARGRQTNVHPQKLKMPMQMRRRFADYYFNWGLAFSLENYKGLWKDTLALSISYNPSNMRAWYHHIIGFLPYSVRLTLIKLYRALYYRLGSVSPPRKT